MSALDMIPVSIAIILLIVFGLYYWSVYKKSDQMAKDEKDNWPPYKSHCPDYWKPVGNSCVNTHNIGLTDRLGKSHGKIKPIQDNMVSFQNVAEKEKCVWAKECEVPWQGVDTLDGCTA